MKITRYDERGHASPVEVPTALLRPLVEWLLNTHRWRNDSETLFERIEKFRRAMIQESHRQETARRNKAIVAAQQPVA